MSYTCLVPNPLYLTAFTSWHKPLNTYVLHTSFWDLQEHLSLSLFVLFVCPSRHLWMASTWIVLNLVSQSTLQASLWLSVIEAELETCQERRDKKRQWDKELEWKKKRKENKTQNRESTAWWWRSFLIIAVMLLYVGGTHDSRLRMCPAGHEGSRALINTQEHSQNHHCSCACLNFVNLTPFSYTFYDQNLQRLVCTWIFYYYYY